MKKLLIMSIMSLSLLANNQISNDEIESTNKGIKNLAELKNVNGFGAKTIESLKGTLEAKPCKEKPKK